MGVSRCWKSYEAQPLLGRVQYKGYSASIWMSGVVADCDESVT